MPFPALIPLVTKIGSMIGGSLLGSKLGKSSPSKLEQQVIGSNLEAQKRGLDLSGELIPQGKSLFSMAQPALQQAMNFFSPIVSGDKSRVTAGFAPEIQRIGQGYQAANRTSAALSSRGGPSAAYRANLPYQQQRDVSTMMQSARPAAATQLFEMGQGTQLAGSNLINNAIQAIYGSTAAGRDILFNEQQRAARDREAGQSIGKSIFDLSNSVDWGSIFGGGGTPRRTTVQSPRY